MATLTLKKLKCFKQEDWTGDDDIQIVVHTSSRKVVWNKAIDTNQTCDLGNLKEEFSGSARIQLMEVDWPDGDDDLGSVTVKESDAAAVDIEGKFTQDDANYTLWYRVSAEKKAEDPKDDGIAGPKTDADAPKKDSKTEGPKGTGDAKDPKSKCPMGKLSAVVKKPDGTAVVGATVRVVELARALPTVLGGKCEFGPVMEGKYTVEASKDGLSPNPASTIKEVTKGNEAVAELVLSDVLMEVRPKGDAKWYVNMAADESAHHGREISVEAEVKPKVQGVRVYFTLDKGAKNRGSLPEDMKAKLSPDTALTDANGIAKAKLTLSRYGGDKFRVSASLNKGTTPGTAGAKETGWFEVWRKLYYELDCMKRSGGGSYSNRANPGGLKTEFNKVFVELRTTGADSAPAHQRIVHENEVDNWAKNLRSGGGKPRYFQLVLLDTIAWDEKTTTETWSFPFAKGSLALPASSYTIDSRDWFVSASYKEQGATPKMGNLTKTAFHLDIDSPYDTNKLSVDLSGIAGLNPTVKTVDVTLKFKTWTEGSGIQSGPGTVIGMRWRERKFAGGQLTNSTLNTMVHEVGHAMGLAATKLPDGTALATTYYKNGHHCKVGTNTCVMWETNSQKTAYCGKCNDACRGRNLASLPITGSASY